VRIAKDIDPDMSISTLASVIEQAADTGLRSACREYGVQMSEQQIAMVNDFILRVKEAPTAYFESKLLRPVRFSEFQCAVIPDYAKARIEPILRQNGVSSIWVYEGYNEQKRIAAIKEACAEILHGHHAHADEDAAHESELDAEPDDSCEGYDRPAG